MTPITALYALPLTALFLLLSWRVIGERRSNRLAYGDGDSPRIQAKIRAQANWVEYAPITLLLMILAELNTAPALGLHLTGALLLIGRLLHGIGMSFLPKQLGFRFWGMILTLCAVLTAMLTLALSLS